MIFFTEKQMQTLAVSVSGSHSAPIVRYVEEIFGITGGGKIQRKCLTDGPVIMREMRTAKGKWEAEEGDGTERGKTDGYQHTHTHAHKKWKLTPKGASGGSPAGSRYPPAKMHRPERPKLRCWWCLLIVFVLVCCAWWYLEHLACGDSYESELG